MRRGTNRRNRNDSRVCSVYPGFNLERWRRSSLISHFDGKRFFNPDAPQARGFLDVLRWKLTSRPEPGTRFVADVEPSKPPASVEGDALRVTLVNHSTVLLQQSGLHILTDPIWSERASPFTWIGPRRRREPGVRWEDLPRIDHRAPQPQSLRSSGSCHLAPAGRSRRNPNSSFRLGVARSAAIPGHRSRSRTGLGRFAAIGSRTTIHCVPALHFSARGFFDRNRTLWCGYVIETAGPHRLFRGRHGLRRPLRPNPRAIRSAASGAAADRSLRAALVHVAGPYGAR